MGFRNSHMLCKRTKKLQIGCLLRPVEEVGDHPIIANSEAADPLKSLEGLFSELTR